MSECDLWLGHYQEAATNIDINNNTNYKTQQQVWRKLIKSPLALIVFTIDSLFFSFSSTYSETSKFLHFNFLPD